MCLALWVPIRKKYGYGTYFFVLNRLKTVRLRHFEKMDPNFKHTLCFMEQPILLLMTKTPLEGDFVK